MGTPDMSPEHEIHFREEVKRGADPEDMIDLGYRVPETPPSTAADRLASKIVAVHVANELTTGASPAKREATSDDSADRPPLRRRGPEIDTVIEVMRRQKPILPPPAKTGKSTTKKRHHRPRPSARTQMFADGRGSDPDLM